MSSSPMKGSPRSEVVEVTPSLPPARSMRTLNCPLATSPRNPCGSRGKSAFTPTTKSRSRNCTARLPVPGGHMAIYLPGTAEELELSLEDLTPREIVAELDKHVVGQRAAKRAVAIALRNRMRRQKLPPDLAEEIMPKNIIMIGPTGVGKTEIARRLAKLTNSPFMKVEASKFTEVGYVGRDVESMIRDLVEIAVDMVREEKLEEVEDRAELNAEERLLDLLLPPSPAPTPAAPSTPGPVVVDGSNFPPASQESHHRTREKLRQQFRES